MFQKLSEFSFKHNHFPFNVGTKLHISIHEIKRKSTYSIFLAHLLLTYSVFQGSILPTYSIFYETKIATYSILGPTAPPWRPCPPHFWPIDAAPLSFCHWQGAMGCCTFATQGSGNAFNLSLTVPPHPIACWWISLSFGNQQFVHFGQLKPDFAFWRQQAPAWRPKRHWLSCSWQFVQWTKSVLARTSSTTRMP